MADRETYWSVVEPICGVVNIYEGPEIFLATFGQVRREAGLLYAAHFCQSEVCDGGFERFFHNSTGVLAPEVVPGFEAIMQVQISHAVTQAMNVLGTPDLRDRSARQTALGRLPPDSFNELDTRLFALMDSERGGFDVAADSYATRVAG
jgi:hypothetical protein